MSDNVQWVVDLEASPEQAQALAEKVTAWLLTHGIVSNTVCSERSYRDSELLLPGPVAAEWSVGGAVERPLMHGLDIVTERTVFHSGDNGIQGLRCPQCEHDHDPADVPWSDAVQAWFEAQGPDALRCPACGCDSGIVDWQFLDLNWAFGNLAFGFWNWPISETLADEIAAVLDHRCRLVHEHL